MSALVVAGIGVLGGVGSIARVLVAGAVTRRSAAARAFPLGILAVNLSGALLLGVLAGAALSGDGHRLLATGLLGSYTTFSTWILDSRLLAARGRRRAAALNIAGSLVLGIAAVWLGRQIGAGL